MAKSYHSAALPTHAAAIARLDVLEAFAGSAVFDIDMLLSVTFSPCIDRISGTEVLATR